MRKLVIVSLLVCVLFIISGCVDYKAYAGIEEGAGDDDLLQQIAEIERELTIRDPAGAVEEPEIIEELEAVVEDEGIVEEPEPEEQEITVSLDEGDRSNLKRVEVDENDPVSLKVTVTDPDKDKTTVKYTAPLNNNGEWKTNYGDAGEYVVTISVSDGKVETTRDVLLVVNRVNVPPEIEKLSDITVAEGEVVNIDPKVSDPNGDDVTMTFSEPLTEGKWETDHTGAGEYEITVTATDGELETKESFLLTVEDVNVLPEITNVGDITINEGETVNIEPVITDLDNDELKLTISDPVGNDGVWETRYTDHGTYKITVAVDDGKDIVTETVTLTVNDVNMPPEIVEITLG